MTVTTLTSRTKRLLVIAAAALALCAAAATSSSVPSANAATYTTLTGVVVFPSGAPVPNATVTFLQWNGYWKQTGQTKTNAQGRYTASAVAGYYYAINTAAVTGRCLVGIGEDLWTGGSTYYVLANGSQQALSSYAYWQKHIAC